VVEQSRRLSAARLGSRVTVTALKLGSVHTNVRRQFPLWMKIAVPLLLDPFITLSADIVAASAERLLLASDFEGKSGALFTQIKRMKSAPVTGRTFDPQEGQRLWELSERLVEDALGATRCSEG
jgi:hypothetical protein